MIETEYYEWCSFEEDELLDLFAIQQNLERLFRLSCHFLMALLMQLLNQQIFPKENNLDKTKWKSILTVEPKAFFDKYLQQYPGDTRAAQPVVVFRSVLLMLL